MELEIFTVSRRSKFLDNVLYKNTCCYKSHFNEHSILLINSTVKYTKNGIQQILMKPHYKRRRRFLRIRLVRTHFYKKTIAHRAWDGIVRINGHIQLSTKHNSLIPKILAR